MLKTNDTIRQDLERVIPGGVNSPVRACKAMGQAPMIVQRGQGAFIFDIDGNRFDDFCLSWGALILGHANQDVVQAVCEQAKNGSSFGISCEAEFLLADKIVKNIPSIEKVRFVSSGTEATMSAVRLARGYTDRDLIVKFDGNYHGHADTFLVSAGSYLLKTPATAGVPADTVKHTVSLPYNDIDSVRTFLQQNQVAAVILEPIAGNMGVVPASQEFLQMLRDETAKQDALLIFDEVISGFRASLQGAQGLVGIQPDLTCLGKVIGGGFPAAAFGGKKEIMDYLAPNGPVFQAGTLSGNPVAMQAGLATLNQLCEPGFYETLEKKANIITKPIQDLIDEKGINACLTQVGSMFTLFFGCRSVGSFEDTKKLDLDQFAKFFRYMYQNGVYIPPMQQEAWFVSSAHQSESLERVRDLVVDFLCN